jgi:hypothetical protein
MTHLFRSCVIFGLLGLSGCAGGIAAGSVAGAGLAPATVSTLAALGPAVLSDLGVGATVLSDTAKISCAAQSAFNTASGLVKTDSTAETALSAASQVAGQLCTW